MAIETVRTLHDVRRQRKQILVLARRHHVRQVLVFASILRDDSDVDFLVEFKADYKLHDHIRLTQELWRLMGRRVEVVHRLALREAMRATVLEKA